ncbi:hypothetical protein J2X31_000889 [Flavobacterium arsenatis]|uniref:Shedu protein SduA C-terminal domain-containing protein n=1 Tax=Flavobacterium arsenatis TaxID=1484332 RepID=A0ABU1TLQ4_9FLAO|nr:Shedu anti-phage system protein SduA domain-containing protein [Flavobacterium arsenatis]MDR6966889.1 hypothetical protein [Flavobacterium arsenatis]
MNSNRDFSKLNDDELNAFEEYNSFHIFPPGKTIKILTPTESMKQMEILLKYPALKNFESLFPNYYLNNFDIRSNKLDYIRKLQLFIELLQDKDITERNILNFIRAYDAQFIISSVLKFTNYGHHDRYIFQEVSLPPDHQADFLIVGKNSHGYHFLLVELENPYNSITIKDGNFGATIRKGITQIDDWKIWMDKNFSTFNSVLSKLKGPNVLLPIEFFEYDNTRFQYVVIAGRRDDFSEKTYRASRSLQGQGKILIHYDNLIDEARNIIDAGRY